MTRSRLSRAATTLPQVLPLRITWSPRPPRRTSTACWTTLPSVAVEAVTAISRISPGGGWSRRALAGFYRVSECLCILSLRYSLHLIWRCSSSTFMLSLLILSQALGYDVFRLRRKVQVFAILVRCLALFWWWSLRGYEHGLKRCSFSQVYLGVSLRLQGCVGVVTSHDNVGFQSRRIVHFSVSASITISSRERSHPYSSCYLYVRGCKFYAIDQHPVSSS